MSKKVTNIHIYNSKVKWKDCFDIKLVDNVIEMLVHKSRQMWRGGLLYVLVY